MDLSIIIPAYNEAKRISPVLKEYLAYFQKKISKFEIIIVVEGTDRTLNIVKNFRKKNKKIKYIYSKKRLGKGGAIIKGFKIASGDLIGFVDADGAIAAKSFNKLVKNIDKIDGIIGSRLAKGAVILKQRPLLQLIGGRGFNILTKLLFWMPFKDTQCGAKLFKKKVIKKIVNNLYITNFAFDIDLLFEIKKNNFIVKEIPITWSHIEGSTFKFSNFFWKLIPLMFLSLIKIRLKEFN